MELLAFAGDLYGNLIMLVGILVFTIISFTCYESKSTIKLE